MRLNKILNELEDIPIKTYTKYNNDQNFEPPRNDEPVSKFNPNTYKLKTGVIKANSEEELDNKVDAFIEKAKDRLPIVYNYKRNDYEQIAYIVYYELNVGSLEPKYKKALERKIEEYADTHSKENNVEKNKVIKSLDIVSNIQRALKVLSPKSKNDLETYVNKYIQTLELRDKHAKK